MEQFVTFTIARQQKLHPFASLRKHESRAAERADVSRIYGRHEDPEQK